VIQASNNSSVEPDWKGVTFGGDLGSCPVKAQHVHAVRNSKIKNTSELMMEE